MRRSTRFLRRLPIRKVLLFLACAVVVLNWTYGRLPSAPRPTGRFAQVGALRIRYLERHARGEPVVFIHGLPGTADDFDLVTPTLSSLRTIAFDRPGFGYSTGGYVPFERQLRAIHELLGALHVRKPILVGHSFGGTIALGFAERYPGDVRGLVLVDAPTGNAHHDAFRSLEMHFLQATQVPVVRQIADGTFLQLLLTWSADRGAEEAFGPDPVPADYLKRLLSLNMTHGDLEALSGEFLSSAEVMASVGRKVPPGLPCVVIQADGDRLVEPSDARRLVGESPSCRLRTVSGGHMVPYTHPAAITAAIRTVAGLGPRTAGAAPRSARPR